MFFLLSPQFLMTERMYIATLVAKESNVLSLFGVLCSGIAFFFFLQREFSSLKEKEEDPREGGSIIMFLQPFSSRCWTLARTSGVPLQSSMSGSRAPLSPLLQFPVHGAVWCVCLFQHAMIGLASCQEQKGKKTCFRNGPCRLGAPGRIGRTKK